MQLITEKYPYRRCAKGAPDNVVVKFLALFSDIKGNFIACRNFGSLKVYTYLNTGIMPIIENNKFRTQNAKGWFG